MTIRSPGSHPPEECITSLGWQPYVTAFAVDESERDGNIHAVRALERDRRGNNRHFAFVSNGKRLDVLQEFVLAYDARSSENPLQRNRFIIIVYRVTPNLCSGRISTTMAITRLFNGIFRTGHFPTRWKLGKVITLLKPHENPADPFESPSSPRSQKSSRSSCSTTSAAKLRCVTSSSCSGPNIPLRYNYRELPTKSPMLSIKRRPPVAALLDMEKAFKRV